MKSLIYICSASLNLVGSPIAAAPTAELVSVAKLSATAPHSAFTDLIRWKGQFYCAFREGRSHVSADGRIRVLSSANGADWASTAELSLKGHDLRDASLSITPDGRLMLNGGVAPRKIDRERVPTGTFVSFTDDGRSWSPPKIIIEPGHWLWRVTWHGDRAYGVAYSSVLLEANERHTQLLTSTDGLSFTPLVSKLLNDGWPTEATLRFATDGTAYCLQRRDGPPRYQSALLGVSQPPYTQWHWHDLGMYVGGPNLIQLPNGVWLAAGRFFNGTVTRTKLAFLDIDARTLVPLLELPSGGDNSYPGLVWHNGLLWMSYYSSHEDKTCVYLAKVRVRGP